MGQPRSRSLPGSQLIALLLAQFVVAFGYGFLLPILPLIVRQTAGAAAAVARNTGLLTGIYTLALFLFAPLWGRWADRHGRRRAMAFGLGGFALSFAVFSGTDLVLLYTSRFIAGAFAAATAPAAYAIVSDCSPSKEWRARRFLFLNVAASLGYLAGPMAGGLMLSIIRELLPNADEALVLRVPFLITALWVTLAAAFVWLALPKAGQVPSEESGAGATQGGRAAILRLLAISFVTAMALGAFEVGLSLRATQTLAMSSFDLGLMFGECMIVMLVVQALIFSPIVNVETTHRFLMPGLVILALSLAALPLAGPGLPLIGVVAAVAASGGILAPIATYWVSLNAGDRQGADLGSGSAVANLGQAMGSAAVGLLFRATFFANAAFILVALIVLSGVLATIGLTRSLSSRRGMAIEFRDQRPPGF